MLAGLPAEVRLQVLLMALHNEDHDIEIRQGWLNPVKNLCRAGLPLAELIDVFLQANIFVIDKEKRSKRFETFLSTHQANRSLRTIRPVRGYGDFLHFAAICPGLSE